MLPFILGLLLLGAGSTSLGAYAGMKNFEEAEKIIEKTNTLARNKQKELEDSLNELSMAFERASIEYTKGWATLNQFVVFMEKNDYRVIIKNSENYIDSHELIHQLKNMTNRMEKIKKMLVDNQKQNSMEFSNKERAMFMASILGITSCTHFTIRFGASVIDSSFMIPRWTDTDSFHLLNLFHASFSHFLKSREMLAQSKEYEKKVMEAVKHMELQIQECLLLKRMCEDKERAVLSIRKTLSETLENLKAKSQVSSKDLEAIVKLAKTLKEVLCIDLLAPQITNIIENHK
jgi:hypothetical protein